MSTVKYLSDVGALAREQDGYIPIDDEDPLEEEFDIPQGLRISSCFYYKENSCPPRLCYWHSFRCCYNRRQRCRNGCSW